MFQRILVSVSNKAGVVDFISPFAQAGAQIISSGGTAKTLHDAGLRVQEVSDYTGFPECMDGRVKTLHPKVHMGLLYRPHISEDLDLLTKHEVVPFDLVVVNLYPFEEAQARGVKDEDLIEFIDIGGPSMLRSAAKNFENICVVCDPGDYHWILQKDGNLSLDDRMYLAAKVFQWTSMYDQMISKHFFDQLQKSQERNGPLQLKGELVSSLRYGENPQQKAWWYKNNSTGLHQAQILQGKALSYNNILDLNAACSAVRLFNGPTAVAVKHNNPCGVATGSDPVVVLDQALKSDPVSVFGGIVAVNFPLGPEEARKLNELFLECVIAPEITPEAQEIFSEKKNLRILRWPEIIDKTSSGDGRQEVRSVDGGFLVQTSDVVDEGDASWQIIGETPSEDIKRDLLLAWKVCSVLKSNAIAVAGDGKTLGLGMGQVNRVDAVKQALERVQQFHKQSKNLVLASDAFFPFADSVEYAAKQGVRWIIQPGGSVRDAEVIECAKANKVNMILTGKRHFKH
jgi:phosphoribosylaminoimidazolecarboxamide formyltransferase / IMP cyclohydrolase